MYKYMHNRRSTWSKDQQIELLSAPVLKLVACVIAMTALAVQTVSAKAVPVKVRST